MMKNLDTAFPCGR